MPTSTLISYAGYASNYLWDGITGILFTAGMAPLLIALLIICSLISLVIYLITHIFKL